MARVREIESEGEEALIRNCHIYVRHYGFTNGVPRHIMGALSDHHLLCVCILME